MKKHLPLSALLLAGSLFIAYPAHANIYSWKWSFTDSNGDTASGAYVTNDGTPGGEYTSNGSDLTSGLIYTILNISGTYTPAGGPDETITGLDASFQADQTFMVDGTPTSPFFLDAYGIGFITDASTSVNFFNGSGSYPVYSSNPASAYTYTNPGGTYALTQSNVAIPFQFDPEQGFILGIPLFLGLRRLKQKKLQFTKS